MSLRRVAALLAVILIAALVFYVAGSRTPVQAPPNQPNDTTTASCDFLPWVFWQC